ncbi:BMP family ABC transporter substrate-binding protein [Kosmotoga olearia]|uniref:Basic membrane lipoprotein n=1 Tax=Kosmotoga olearia (strain ATCC BAA-1733 / DSM 21960 / TBF 19.5.1) TaxID=521045 RepID=C5CD77_KOSOT|nr:BMP family ABC transporter substrate-binding protein [Kosmotoga olearia]ACR79021.1 basic membrane lipoprotein [Kosmotoga olearia TBF 19.5.1]
MKIHRFQMLLLVIFLMTGIGIAKGFTVGIMIPGEIGGNPIYELVFQGAERAREEGINVKLVEGGYNPGKWEPLLRAMAASGRYDLLITFTEGLPQSVKKLAVEFQKQKFALIDGKLNESISNVYSVAFRDEEMTFLAGIFAGLITVSELPGVNPDPVVGLIAGDTYPAMMNKMKPGFENGVRFVLPDAKIIFSVAGNWADPGKGRELASKQFDEGVDVILSIAGGTGIGIIEEAARRGKYVIGVDSNIISMRPGTILACSLKHIDRVVYETIMAAADGTITYGVNETVGVFEGVIDFTFEDPHYLEIVPERIQEIMKASYILLKYGILRPLEE